MSLLPQPFDRHIELEIAVAILEVKEAVVRLHNDRREELLASAIPCLNKSSSDVDSGSAN
jgi:hypothetical protein